MQHKAFNGRGQQADGTDAGTHESDLVELSRKVDFKSWTDKRYHKENELLVPDPGSRPWSQTLVPDPGSGSCC